MVKLAYTTRDEIRINSTQRPSTTREKSPDYGQFMQAGPSTHEAEEHVLILDLLDNVKGHKPGGTESFQYGSAPSQLRDKVCAYAPGRTLALPPSMTPAQVKKLIGNRNKRFSLAVEE